MSLFFSLVSSIALKVETDSSTEALGVLLLFTLAVPPVAAFLFESNLDFEKGCHVSYIKEKAIGCFTSTLGRCFDHYLREKNVVHNIEVETEESCTSAAKVSDRESAAGLERSARASSSERSPPVHDVGSTREEQARAGLQSEISLDVPSTAASGERVIYHGHI